jgi:hypothetical protein
MRLKNGIVAVLVVLMIGIPAQGSLMSSMTGYWPLDGDSDDHSGNGRHGVIMGGAAFVQGRYGQALAFDGTDGYVDVAGYDGFLQPHWCVASWVHTTNAGDLDIVSWGTEGGGTKVEFRLNAGRPRIEHGNGNIRADIEVHDGEWHHVLAQLPDGGTMQDVAFYVDGNAMAIFAVGNGGNPFITTAGIPVNIGRSGPRADRYFNGNIDEVLMFDRTLTPNEVLMVMAGQMLPREIASAPNPAAGATDVWRDKDLRWTPGEYAVKHDVYLGTSFADVNDADRADPMGVLASQGQDANTYDPGRLVLGQTYYWRIDEVNAAPDGTVFRGPVWSFTVEPVSYAVPVDAVSAAASSATEGQNPGNTVNGSGLNENNAHSDTQEDMWLAATTDANPWIQFEFTKLHKLDKVHIWNHNTQTETILGFGIKEALIEASADGENWNELGTITVAQATGSESYTGEAYSLNGTMARFVRITGLSNYSLLGLPQRGLAEVRFYYIPVLAREPLPADGSTTNGVDVTLQWRPGREAVEHQVVFSADEQAVIDGSAVIATVPEPSCDPGTLDLGTSYFWKINEMNDLGTPPSYEGDLWTFQTPEDLMIDDMEMYKAEEGLFIWEHWIDGFEDNTNGSIVGNGDDAEKAIVYEGSQSLPMAYDNATAPISEATRYFDTPVDLTVGNPESLKLQVRGDAPGFVDHGDGTYTVGAAGADIWNTADDFRFVYKKLSGDGSITARVDSCTQANVWTKAGLMIRESLSEDAANSISFVTPTGRVGTQWRDTTFAATVSTRSETEGEIALPYWVRLTRTGNMFKGEQSADGATWQPMFQSGTPTLPTEMEIVMIPDVFIGLAITSHQTGVAASAVFSNVSTTGNVTGSWTAEAIGADTHPDNDAAPIYVRIADTAGKEKTFDHPDPAATIMTGWDEWTLPLGDLSPLNVTRIDSITLGVGGSGVQGKIYLDAVRTNRPYPVPEVPAP